uniref:Si:ch211-212k18.7 n=1 Tax=Cyprinus carpio TaxID=7962 RepID=A0A8C2EN77_CYPCA
MKYTLLLIALCIAATALTSGEYSSAYMATGANITTAPTTTHNPNTTTHNTSTTTLTPKTTVTTAIPSPTPPTNMAVGHYNFSLDGKLCVMIELAIGIRVNTSKVNDTFIVQPNKTTVSGECGDKASTIVIGFKEGQFTLKFRNVSNETIKKVYVEYMDYDLNYAFKTGELNEYSGKNESLELFSVDLGHSYSCKTETLYMGGGVSLDLTHNRFQAFDFKNNEFGPPELCKADIPDYRVAITVGIILVLLIIIVVIAYLINRKRRTDGYQSL